MGIEVSTPVKEKKQKKKKELKTRNCQRWLEKTKRRNDPQEDQEKDDEPKEGEQMDIDPEKGQVEQEQAHEKA